MYVLCCHMSTHSQANAFECVSPSHSAIPTQASVVSIWRKRDRWREGKRQRERNGGGLGSGDGGLSMHAEPQIHSPRLGLRTSHTHTNTHIPTPPSPETPPGPCSVSVSSWSGNFTNSLHNVTCSHCLNFTMAGLNGHAVFTNAAIAAPDDMFALSQPAANLTRLSLFLYL